MIGPSLGEYNQCYTDLPTVQPIWNRSHIARKAGRTCCCCKEPIEPGQKYEDWGNVVDGIFERSVMHFGAYRYPSGCPKLMERDRQEMAEAGY